MHAVHQVSHGPTVAVATEKKAGIGAQLKRLSLQFVESFVHNASKPHSDCRQHCVLCVVKRVLVGLATLPAVTQAAPEPRLELPGESRPEIGKVIHPANVRIVYAAVRSAY